MSESDPGVSAELPLGVTADTPLTVIEPSEETTTTKPLTLLELFNEPEWLKTLADVVKPDQKQVIRIRKWSRNHDEVTLSRVAYSVAEMWDIYKTKNKSIYATYMNWVRMEEDREKKRAVPAGVLPRSQQDKYGAEAHIQKQGIHPSSEEAKKIRREWNHE